MKILFTQFTPPFVQGVSSASPEPEMAYLEYRDWFSELRRLTARRDTVKFASFTRKGRRISIERDGYESVFFPVSNPDEPIRDGRWDFHAPGLVDWVREFDPDVVHIIGNGHRMALEIMRSGYAERTCQWERTTFREAKLDWEETHRARYLVLPTEKVRKELERVFPPEKLLTFPLGANVTDFAPDPGAPKDFDVISVGRITRAKHIDVVRDIVRKNDLSWLHAGAVRKGWPFTGLENLAFMSRMRKRLGLRRVKRARHHPHTCGFFENHEMPALYNRSKVLVHPSSAEGAPRCVQEALACGVPVVVLKDTVPYVEPGFGIKCESHDEFEGAVMEILGDDERRVEMGRRGREWIVENHSPEKLHEALDRVNHQVAAESGGLKARTT